MVLGLRDLIVTALRKVLDLVQVLVSVLIMIVVATFSIILGWLVLRKNAGLLLVGDLEV